MTRNFLMYISVCTLLIIIGCSGNGALPTIPDNEMKPDLNADNASQIPIIVSDTDESGYPTGGLATIGMYYGELNLKTLDISFTPLRSSSANGVNDSLIVDITNFLSISPCSSCIDIKGVSLDSYNRPVLTIGISHPFQPGNQFEPPSATNRLDLHVFTPRGFIISNGLIGGGAMIFPGLDEEIPAWKLANASGYAGEFDKKWDEVFNTRATLHPYILHFDDYSFGNYSKDFMNGFQNPGLPTGNTVMRMGAPVDYKDYVIDIISSQTETFTFVYALTVSYGLSAKGKFQWLDPTYRVPLYCGKSASMVKLSSIDNKLDDMNTSSYADLTIQVLDINHGIDVGTDIDKMDYDSSVKSIYVDCPDLSVTPFSVEDASTVLQGGNGRIVSDPLRFKVRITNTKLASPGNYIGLIKVLDNYPTNSNLNLGGQNAIPAVPPYIDPTTRLMQVEEWATYTVFKYTIVVGNRPPECDVRLAQQIILGGSTAKASPGSGTGDPDGSIVLYEYDSDYDGEIFDVDASNTTGAEVELGPYVNESGHDILYTIAMRVTDNNNPAANAICTIELSVQHFSPVIFFDDFTDNSNNWQYDPDEFWGIKDGFLGSSAGPGAAMYGLGCYADDLGANDRNASSDAINIPALPEGYSTVRVTIVHAFKTEIFQFNPFDFTDDCDLWVKPPGTEKFKLITTGGTIYTTNEFTSKDGPSFAGIQGVVPCFGQPFEGVTTTFDNSSLAGQSIRLKFRQQTDDGIDNCLGGWWIDSIKVEFIRF